MESIIQSRVINTLELCDWFVLKLSRTNKNGIPDLFCQKKGFSDFYCEVKDYKGEIDPLQLYRLWEIQNKTDSKVCIYWPDYSDNIIRYEDIEIQVLTNITELKEYIQTLSQCVNNS